MVDAPDADAPTAGRVWSAETGGCEGMGQVKGEEREEEGERND